MEMGARDLQAKDPESLEAELGLFEAMFSKNGFVRGERIVDPHGYWMRRTSTPSAVSYSKPLDVGRVEAVIGEEGVSVKLPLPTKYSEDDRYRMWMRVLGDVAEGLGVTKDELQRGVDVYGGKYYDVYFFVFRTTPEETRAKFERVLGVYPKLQSSLESVESFWRHAREMEKTNAKELAGSILESAGGNARKKARPIVSL